jgi:hypothetical protein
MYRMLLYTQWKWSRLGLAILAVAAFMIPLLSVGYAGTANAAEQEAMRILATVQRWSVYYPVIASALGLFVAGAAWRADHQGGHVYALTLPVPRWRYVLLRFGAGALLLAVPVVLLWVGAVVASMAATVPPGLHAYPHALAIRFALAALVAYAVFFGISAGSARTAGIILSVIGGLVLVQFLLAATGNPSQFLFGLFDRLVVWPGPLEVFTGSWMLIDV